MSNLRQNGQLRWAPSFLRNRGKVTRAQKRAMRDWWPEYGIRFEFDEVIDLDSYYDFDGPLLIEIGFGMGDHLTHLAESLPDHRILGIEVHRPGLAAATLKAHQSGLENVRLIRGDARLVLTDHLPQAIASAILIQFPDPWPKAGDEHRRLVQPEMVETMAKTLLPGGQCLITTDVDDYADHCRAVFAGARGWRESKHSDLQAYRMETLYESKAKSAGSFVTDLCYQTD